MEKAKICRYFQNGHCKLKNDCPFVHKKEMKKICRFYKAGQCKKGDNCDFYHQDEQQTVVKYEPVIEKRKVRQQPYIPIQEQKQEQVIEQKTQISKQMLDRQQAQKKEDKIKLINAMLGIKQPQVKQPEINYLKKIVVTFMELSKSIQGKQNIERINKTIFGGKPYLEFIKTLQDPHQKQLAQIIRRFQYSFNYLDEQKTKYEIRISPVVAKKQINLNFDIKQKTLILHISHQNGKPTIKLVNKSIPEYFAAELNTKIAFVLEKRNVFETIKYIENNFELICEQVDFVLENKRFNEKDLAFQYDGGFEEMDLKKNPSNIIKKQDKEIEKVEEPVEEQKEQKEIIPEIELTNTITLQTLQTNAESLLVEEILLHMVCECSAMITYILKAKKRKMLTIRAKIKCTKCRQIITIYLKRQILHKDALRVVAYAGCIGAALEQIGAVLWKINCVCENVIISQELSLSGIKKIIKCFDCFKEYFIQYFGIFKQNPFLQEEKTKVRYETKLRDAGFKLDTELPNKGICKHYKFSFRFFRFPCCGRAYPCQKCHQEKSDKHDWDNRASIMICGFCSCEQPVTDICKRCKKQLVKGAQKSGHWEGGKGCRDQALLSKNDPKKYVGLNKTIPNKK